LVIAPKKRSIYNPVILLDQVLLVNLKDQHTAEPVATQAQTGF
jgi:hypothetical protein